MADFLAWGARGFSAELIPIMPPGVQIDPSSRVPEKNRGKVPGKRKTPWSWTGFSGWEGYVQGADDYTNWTKWGASLGIRTKNVPSFDIDVEDEDLVRLIQDTIQLELGKTPIRRGNPPRVLLPYRLALNSNPFRKRVLKLAKDGEKIGVVELLADGQQFVAAGVHPRTGNEYAWTEELWLSELEEISEEEADATLQAIQAALLKVGVVALASLAGGHGEYDQEASTQVAPDKDLLREALLAIPNDDEVDYEAWISMGAAIRGACADDVALGFELWQQWSNSGQWTTPSELLEDKWASFADPKLGYEFIYAEAGVRGWTGAAEAAFADEPDFQPPPRAGKPAPPPREQVNTVVGSARSQTNLGDRLAARWQGHRIFIYEIGTWVEWTESNWADISTSLVEVEATDWVRQEAAVLAQNDAAFEKMTTVAFINGILTQATRRLSRKISEFDQEENILGFPGGMVDLRTGKILAPDPKLLIRKQLACGPDASVKTPAFNALISTMYDGDLDLVRYWLYALGCILRGDEQSRKCFWIFGVPGSGKTTLVTLIHNLFGSYSKAIDASMMSTKSRSSEVRYEIATLDGCRLVVNIEMEINSIISGGFIKRTLGNDDAPLSARSPYGKPFEVRPKWAMLVASNALPEFSQDDIEALRRRLVPVPAMGRPKGAVRGFSKRLNAELPGILALMIKYLQKYNGQGMPFLQAIEDETDAALEGMNSSEMFVDRECTVDPEEEVERNALYLHYEAWCMKEDLRPQSKRGFANDLRKLGFTPKQEGAVRSWIGLNLD